MTNPIYTKSNYRKNITLYWKQFYPEWSIPKGYHVHHIKPKSCGGSHLPNNLIALHPNDHVSIHRCRGDNVSGKLINVSGTFFSKEHRRKLSESQIGKTLSKETKEKLSISSSGENSHWFCGYYHTPWGKFVSTENITPLINKNTIRRWCKQMVIVTNRSYGYSDYLKSLGARESIVGKTYRELGFWFEHKS